ncbi:MAG TPA: hypothetical protein VG496_03585, partial [Myxococcales bacterium]|nr:hypothetical protein [Myxococcales bacterium]
PNAECADMVGGPNTTALLTDIPIVAVRAGSIDFEAVPGFEPDPSCFSSGLVGGTFQVHAGETTAGGWVVLEGLDVLTRLPHGTQLIVTGARDDYPLPAYPADAGNAPPGPVDVALSFTVTGAEPSIEGTNQVLIFSNGETLTSIRDVSNAGSPGFAGPVLAYSSPRRAKDALGTPSDELVFTAITGSNSLLYMIPAQFGLPPYLQIFY